MPNIGPVELIVILVIALLILGPGKLPDVGAALGKSVREFRKAATDVQECVKVERHADIERGPRADRGHPRVYVILPFAIAFLPSCGTGSFQSAWTADGYFSFIAMLFLVFGLVMEYSIVLVLLSKVGIIPSARLRSSPRMVILVIAVVAAVVTPGGDPISPTVLG
jgi:TatA/E family protein of Tat protein translocase